MDIVVLAGGLSPERDVSLSSGSLIANALAERGHRVCLLDLLEGTELDWDDLRFAGPGRETVFNYDIPAQAPDLEALAARFPSQVGPRVLEHCRRADAVFVALHGAIGENGQLQSLFDLGGVRYTGTGYIGSLLAMDKDVAKTLVAARGIPTARWRVFDPATVAEAEVGQAIGFPCVVKPLSCGSSVGVSVVRDGQGLRAALDEAARYERKLIVEGFVEGREFSCGVLDGRALPVIEIMPRSGFYDYANKYQKGLTEEVCPARIGTGLAALIQERALAAHEALRLGFYSRTDFIVDSGGEAVFLESNTLPGMTPTSLLPQEAKAEGISYGELCELIVRDALG